MGAITARSNSRRRAASGLLAVPIAAIVLLCVLALAFVTYVLRPRVEAAPATLEAPALPIVVADTLFRVPPRALRVALQRRPGMQERLDLAFFWPAMTPAADPSEDDLAASAGRIFVTYRAQRRDCLPGRAGSKTSIRAISPEPSTSGLMDCQLSHFSTTHPIREKTFLYERGRAYRFLVRCTRDKRATAGSCLL